MVYLKKFQILNIPKLTHFNNFERVLKTNQSYYFHLVKRYIQKILRKLRKLNKIHNSFLFVRTVYTF